MKKNGKLTIIGEPSMAQKICTTCGKVTDQYFIGVGVTECKECGTTNYDLSEDECNKVAFGTAGAGRGFKELSPAIKNKLHGEFVNRQQVLDYIDRISKSGLGKKKSLDYIRKFVSNVE